MRTSDALVVFGATGDLAYKQIFPALQALVKRKHLNVPVIGVAGRPWSTAQLQERVRASLENAGVLDSAAFDKLSTLLSYVGGDYRDHATFSSLRQRLGPATAPLFYLAIPPSLFATVAQGLTTSGSVDGARLVVEKPFGRDLASARKLNKILSQSFPQTSIFRIDHFLGKEAVQNLVYFRFANRSVEAGWDGTHIESVQISMAEAFGVAGRGKFYEEAGALRDVVQNHLLQVLACLAMDAPSGTDSEQLQAARAKLLGQVRTLRPADVVRGQFQGYRKVAGVAPDSTVETFAACRFYIDSERWAGVPFCIRAGKCLPVTSTEAVIGLRTPTGGPFPAAPNYYRFELSPDIAIAMGVNVKTPGENLSGEALELTAHRQLRDEMQPYERLLGDAMRGDATLFANEASVEEAWRVVDPILGNAIPVSEYAPSTWGPTAAQTLAPPGGWRNPSGPAA